jgi:hypothetical protein
MVAPQDATLHTTEAPLLYGGVTVEADAITLRDMRYRDRHHGGCPDTLGTATGQHGVV